MSSHDCRVSGSLTIKTGVTEEQIRDVLVRFLEPLGMNYSSQEKEGNVEIAGGMVSISFDVYGYGDEENGDVRELADNLASLVESPAWLLFQDFDTGNQDSACTPYFIGNEREQITARLTYGVGLMEDWIAPIIGPAAFSTIKSQIIAMRPVQ